MADDIDPNFYYGITMANGMVGMISSPDPLKIKDVVLKDWLYDYYQRGRVSNILKTFNHMNMHLEVDQRRIDRSQIEGYSHHPRHEKCRTYHNFQCAKKSDR